MPNRRFGKNSEERIVENEEAQIDITSPFLPNDVPKKPDYTLPTVNKKRKWWHRVAFLRRRMIVVPGVLFVALVVTTLVALVMLITKNELIHIIFMVWVGIWGLMFISTGVAAIVDGEITTGFSDEPNKTYMGKDATNIGKFLIAWGILNLVVGSILFGIGYW